MGGVVIPRVAPRLDADEWRTLEGALTARELAHRCAASGVRLDRARLTYWQAEGLFPLPEVRFRGRLGSTGYYHEDAVLLAGLVDACLVEGLPYRPHRRRSSLVPLRALLSGWRREAQRGAGDPLEAERRFYARIGEARARLDAGEQLTGDVPATARDPGPARARAVRAVPDGGAPWREATGDIDAVELEAAAARHGIRLDHARRSYWQRIGVFPYGAPHASVPSRRVRGRRTYFPRAAVELAVVIAYCLDPSHPNKHTCWSWSPAVLATTFATWRERVRGRGDGEQQRLFYARIVQLAHRIEHGANPRGLRPPSVPLVAARRRGFGRPGDVGDELSTERTLAAMANEWVRQDPGARGAPEPVIAWFRLEPVETGWRIARTGMRLVPGSDGMRRAGPPPGA